MKIAVVSITKHGIALAGKVVAALPGAQLFCPEKFRTEGEAASFERIRRITGYLVGTLDRFNNAKRAEEHDRVKHGVTSTEA